MTLFLERIISGINLGSIYAIIALGYTMVYGIARMLNFAHGDVIMVGAYICFVAISSFSLPPAVGILLAVVVCTVLGITIERLAYRPLRQAAPLAVLRVSWTGNMARPIRPMSTAAVREITTHTVAIRRARTSSSVLRMAMNRSRTWGTPKYPRPQDRVEIMVSGP